jgi:diketogulonate reductase-like aldo/keto reductase
LHAQKAFGKNLAVCAVLKKCKPSEKNMKYETLHNISIPKIGFGCWSIGGESTANPADDERSLSALRSAVELGYRHFDTAEYYAAGHSEELLGQVVRESGKPREAFFITSKVSPEHLGYDDVLRSCAASLRRLGMEPLSKTCLILSMTESCLVPASSSVA